MCNTCILIIDELEKAQFEYQKAKRAFFDNNLKWTNEEWDMATRPYKDICDVKWQAYISRQCKDHPLKSTPR